MTFILLPFAPVENDKLNWSIEGDGFVKMFTDIVGIE